MSQQPIEHFAESRSETASASPLNDSTDKPALRVALKTYGCRSNYADTVDLQAALVEQGAVPCGLDSEVDVVVINTCTVTDEADREALRLVRKIRKKSPDTRVILTGCMAEIRTEELQDNDAIEHVIGPGRKAELVEAITGVAPHTPAAEEADSPQSSEPALVTLGSSDGHRRVKSALPDRRSISLQGTISQEIQGPGSSIGDVRTRARYHLRVQEGCENSCTFCIIPFSRGRLSSREVSDVLNDIEFLTGQGYREIVLTGTHLGGYGEDSSSSLHALLERIVAAEPRARFRLSSIDPNDLRAETVDLIAKSDIFCEHLHICVQAFSDRILKRMNRRYRMNEVQELLAYVHQRIPGVCIGSDLITGFPGEHRQEVDQGIETFLRLPISYLHVFPYSERAGTAATRLGDEVPVPERKRRAARWRAVAERKRDQFFEERIGSTLECIVERADSQFFFGTTREYVSVKIDREAVRRAGRDVPPLGGLLQAQAIAFDPSDRKLLCQ